MNDVTTTYPPAPSTAEHRAYLRQECVRLGEAMDRARCDDRQGDALRLWCQLNATQMALLLLGEEP